jgi:hypothetical protein
MTNNDIEQRVDESIVDYTSRLLEALNEVEFFKDEQKKIVLRLKLSILSLLTEAETRGRIDENKRWLTVLAPSMDENVACNSDFHERITELKEQS